MSLFKKAVNEQGYLKANFYGFPGSGKSFTATTLAIGLHKALKLEKPIFVVDTEKGFEYLTKRFDEAGIELQVARTRAFTDLLAAMDEAEQNGSILIVDSVTHFWSEIQESYKREHKRNQLRLQDWLPLKQAWSQFPNKFLNSKLHCILCGRAGDDYEYQENEDTGKMEVYKSGTKLLAEKSLGYEPGLVVEMEKINIGQFKRGMRNMANRAHILKDRFDKLDGQSFDDPTFDTFLPHVQGLNIGVHTPISDATSKELFDKNSDKNWSEKRKQVEIAKEEIMGELTSAYPGRSSEEVKAKTDLVYEAFGTRSWVALDDKTPEELKKGLEVIRTKITQGNAPTAAENGHKKEAVKGAKK